MMHESLMKLFTFICPPLAVALRVGKFNSLKVLFAFFLTLIFWIPGRENFKQEVLLITIYSI